MGASGQDQLKGLRAIFDGRTALRADVGCRWQFSGVPIVGRSTTEGALAQAKVEGFADINPRVVLFIPYGGGNTLKHFAVTLQGSVLLLDDESHFLNITVDAIAKPVPMKAISCVSHGSLRWTGSIGFKFGLADHPDLPVKFTDPLVAWDQSAAQL